MSARSEELAIEFALFRAYRMTEPTTPEAWTTYLARLDCELGEALEKAQVSK